MKNLKSLLDILLIQVLQLTELWREPSRRRRIDYQKHFSFKTIKLHIVPVKVFDGKVINICHIHSSFL